MGRPHTRRWSPLLRGPHSVCLPVHKWLDLRCNSAAVHIALSECARGLERGRLPSHRERCRAHLLFRCGMDKAREADERAEEEEDGEEWVAADAIRPPTAPHGVCRCPVWHPLGWSRCKNYKKNVFARDCNFLGKTVWHSCPSSPAPPLILSENGGMLSLGFSRNVRRKAGGCSGLGNDHRIEVTFTFHRKNNFCFNETPF